MRRFVVQRMRDQDVTAAAVSRQLGHYDGYTSQWITKGSPRFLPPDQAQALCVALRILPAEWDTVVRQAEAEYAEWDAAPAGSGAPRLQTAGRARSPLLLAGPSDGKVSGQEAALGGTPSLPVVRLHAAEVIEYVPRPPRLAGVSGAVACWVDEARGARLQAGDLVYLRPGQAARVGDVVALRRDSILVALGDLVTMDAKQIVVRETGASESAYPRDGLVVEKVVCISLP